MNFFFLFWFDENYSTNSMAMADGEERERKAENEEQHASSMPVFF